MTAEPNVCIACRGWCPDPPPFDTGERLRDCVWEEPGDDGAARRLRGWICTECYVVHWAREV